MTINRKLIGGFLVLALITLVAGLMGSVGLQKVKGASQEAVAVELPRVMGLSNLQEAQWIIQGCERILLYERDPAITQRQHQRLAEAWTNAGQAWQVHETWPLPPEEAETWRKSVVKWQEWQATHQEIMTLLHQGDDVSREYAHDLSYGRGRSSFQASHELLQELLNTHVAGARIASEKAATAITQSNIILLGGTLIGLALLLVLGLMVFQDVGEHRKAEKIFQAMVHDAPIGIFIAQHGHFKLLNSCFEEITGYGESELLGKDSLHAVVPADKDKVRENAVRMLKGQISLPYEFQIITKSGESKWILAKVASIDYQGEKATLGYFMDITEQKSLMESLIREKGFFEAAMDSLPGIFYFFDDQLKFVRWNENFERVTGYSAQELSSISPLEFFVGQDRELIGQKILEVFTEGESTVEADLVAKDGERRRFYFTGKRLIFDQERYLLGMGVDVSQRYQAEVALLREKTFSDAIIDSLPGPFYLLDDRGRVIRWNRRHEEVTGYSADEIAVMSPLDYFEGEERELVDSRIQKVFSEGEAEVEAHIVRKNGERTPYYLRAVRQTIGNETYFIGFGVDFTARKQAEEALVRSEELLRKVLGALPVGVWITDHRGNSLLGNSAGQQIWGGARPAGIEGYGDYKGWWADTGKPIAAEEWALARAILKGETSLEELIEIECLDGTRKTILNSAIPLRNDNLEITGAIIVNQDITARRQAEAAKAKLESLLSQAQKMEAIGTLAGGIAHDFNNILGIIIGYSEMLGLRLASTEIGRKELVEVLKAAQRAKDLVKQILTFSRQSQQERRPMDLDPIIRETMKMLRSTIPTTINFRTNIQKTGPVLADPTQIQQVLFNLCANAAHAMHRDGGTLTVELLAVDLQQPLPHPDLAAGSYVKLTVSDTGHGMTTEVIARIFEPFFTTKGVGEGTGLGLSVVHGIIKSHQGAITVYSEPEQGTSFCIYLPLILTQASAEIQTTDPVPRGKGCVLFVDDEEALMELGRKMLEYLGYEVVAKSSSLDALKAFQDQPERFDLVITDYTMPHLTGTNLAKKIKELRADIPIILCTGFSEAVTRESSKEMGIDEYMMKPLAVNELAKTVHRLLKDKRKTV